MVKNLPATAGRFKSCGLDPWVRKIPWRRKWQPIPVFLPGKSNGQRSLAGYSPWSGEESDTTEWLSTPAGMQGMWPIPICPFVTFLHSPVVCKSAYLLWSESISYFPTTLVFSTLFAIISSPVRQLSTFSWKASLTVIQQHRNTYTYTFHITSSGAMFLFPF